MLPEVEYMAALQPFMVRRGSWALLPKKISVILGEVPFYYTLQRNVCVDYLTSYRDFGSQVSCGYVVPGNDLEPNRMLMEFRSNQKLVEV